MKKSILNFGSMMLLFLLVFACSREQDDIRATDLSVTLKGETIEKSEIKYRTDSFSITDLISSQSTYLQQQITDDQKSLRILPERKDATWFHKHFAYLFKESTEANEWIKENVNAKKILIFALTVDKTIVASLVFSDGLTLPKEFENKIGLILDTNTSEGCNWVWCSWGSYDYGPGCHCWSRMCCDWESSWCDMPCPEQTETLDRLDTIFPDIWGLDFESLVEIPVHNIKIGEPVLQ